MKYLKMKMFANKYQNFIWKPVLNQNIYINFIHIFVEFLSMSKYESLHSNITLICKFISEFWIIINYNIA